MEITLQPYGSVAKVPSEYRLEQLPIVVRSCLMNDRFIEQEQIIRSINGQSSFSMDANVLAKPRFNAV